MVSGKWGDCRCVEVEGYGIDRTACRADEHKDAVPPEYVTVRRDDLAWALSDVDHMQDEYGPCGNPTDWIDRLHAALRSPSANSR